MEWNTQEEWDVLDLLAALGQVATLLAAQETSTMTLNQRESSLRITCLWSHVVSRFAVVPAHIRAGQNPRSIATQWRAQGWLDQLAPKEHNWLVRQMLIEIGEAWSALSMLLKSDAPEAAHILGLAVVSPKISLLL